MINSDNTEDLMHESLQLSCHLGPGHDFYLCPWVSTDFSANQRRQYKCNMSSWLADHFLSLLRDRDRKQTQVRGIIWLSCLRCSIWWCLVQNYAMSSALAIDITKFCIKHSNFLKFTAVDIVNIEYCDSDLYLTVLSVNTIYME